MKIFPASWNRWPCEVRVAAGRAHRPVLLEAVMEALAVSPSACYVDATFGRGGHAAGILARLGPEGR